VPIHLCRGISRFGLSQVIKETYEIILVAILKCFVIYELGKCTQNIDIVLSITSREIDLPIQGNNVITHRSRIILRYSFKLLAKKVLQIFSNFLDSSVKVNKECHELFESLLLAPLYSNGLPGRILAILIYNNEYRSFL
jgi:hypothetical protein